MGRFQAAVRLAAVSVCLGWGVAPVWAQDASHGAHRHHRHPRRLVMPKDYTAWSRVATCEEGGWYAPGGNYPDALGVDAVNWHAAGGKPQYGHLSLAQRVYEIRVADRFIRAYHIGIPDQGYCSAW